MAFPSGYRFNPTDEELVVDYLKNKIFKNALPCNIIQEINLYDYHPQQLYNSHKKEGGKFMYFFTPRDRKYPHGNRPKRQAVDGFWKATGVDHPVTVNNIKVASKRSLVYYNGSNKNSTKTNWIMYEYVMDQHSTPAASKPTYSKKSQAAASRSNATPDDSNMKLDDWVLCKVYLKNHKSKNKNQAASSSGASSISAEPQMQGNDGGNLQHNLDSAISVASMMQRAHHNAGGYQNFAPFLQGTDHHHQYNLQSYGGPINVLPPLQIRHHNFGSTRAAQPMDATNYHNVSSTNFVPWTQTQYNGQHYVGSIGISPSIQPNECNAANYVGSTCAASALQGANGCDATDSVDSTNFVPDNVFGTPSSAPPMLRINQCDVGDNNSSINSEPSVTDFDIDPNLYLQPQDPNLYLPWLDGTKPDSPN
ncbi:NAC transcription factor 25-like [Pistacia vera]|uniref:NAC transcription factor 25-like n=1 Tax=Pistacia vera TaxID=55513 RepID=UPI001262E47D|nr:NAC transcription factor 25-like [Pistacia vera]